MKETVLLSYDSEVFSDKVHAAINEIPFERLKKEGLSFLSREYITNKINLRRVQKDCLIARAGNPYSVPAEYVGKDVAVVALDSMLAAYYGDCIAQAAKLVDAGCTGFFSGMAEGADTWSITPPACRRSIRRVAGEHGDDDAVCAEAGESGYGAQASLKRFRQFRGCHDVDKMIQLF